MVQDCNTMNTKIDKIIEIILEVLHDMPTERLAEIYPLVLKELKNNQA